MENCCYMVVQVYTFYDALKTFDLDIRAPYGAEEYNFR